MNRKTDISTWEIIRALISGLINLILWVIDFAANVSLEQATSNFMSFRPVIEAVRPHHMATGILLLISTLVTVGLLGMIVWKISKKLFVSQASPSAPVETDEGTVIISGRDGIKTTGEPVKTRGTTIIAGRDGINTESSKR
ncbi:hypothetical protein [Aquidulcibacter sp.]|uniref:hypothetical protein n=1 Tax=Aquidulcibacter sp. TaxID=2052990 RepID=UPI0025B86458|nr:hypothetical protein [Aquidulcibacter sp.]MCA3696497.1 hypothetical protein [Aquidulcibacter sp.]